MTIRRRPNATTKTSARRFVAAQAGLAAIEFALLAPLMVLLFFGVVEGSNALAASRRVSLSVNTLADLASQETRLSTAQASDLFVGVAQIIDHGPIDAEFRLVSLVIDPDTDEIVVHWSRDDDGGEPYAPGTPYTDLADPGLLDESSSLIVGEVDFLYTPPLTKVLIPSVDFKKRASRWPRRSAKVQLCPTPSTCTS